MEVRGKIQFVFVLYKHSYPNMLGYEKRKKTFKKRGVRSLFKPVLSVKLALPSIQGSRELSLRCLFGSLNKEGKDHLYFNGWFKISGLSI